MPSKKTGRVVRSDGGLTADRRMPSDTRGLAAAFKRLKGLLKRPIRLQRRGLQWEIVVVDRRRRDKPALPPALREVVDELGARLLALDESHAVHGMRHLIAVHHALRRQGWPGVEALPSADLRRALLQLELLVSLEPSRALALLQQRLRLSEAAAQAREDRQREAAAVVAANPDAPTTMADPAVAAAPAAAGSGIDTDGPLHAEVREASFDEYEKTDRAWQDTGQGAAAPDAAETPAPPPCGKVPAR